MRLKCSDRKDNVLIYDKRTLKIQYQIKIKVSLFHLGLHMKKTHIPYTSIQHQRSTFDHKQTDHASFPHRLKAEILFFFLLLHISEETEWWWWKNKKKKKRNLHSKELLRKTVIHMIEVKIRIMLLIWWVLRTSDKKYYAKKSMLFCHTKDRK